MIISLVGCAGTLEVLDVLFPSKPAPVPVCDKETAGTKYNGKACLKYSDGTYKWSEVK